MNGGNLLIRLGGSLRKVGSFAAICFASALVVACSLFNPPYEPTPYESAMGPIAAAKSELEVARTEVTPAEEAYVRCFVGYALDHSQAAATATEVSEAATVACWPQLDHLRAVYFRARDKAARVAELERGTMRPDIAREVDQDMRRTEQMARGKALDLIIRSRTPTAPESTPTVDRT